MEKALLQIYGPHAGYIYKPESKGALNFFQIVTHAILELVGYTYPKKSN